MTLATSRSLNTRLRSLAEAENAATLSVFIRYRARVSALIREMQEEAKVAEARGFTEVAADLSGAADMLDDARSDTLDCAVAKLERIADDAETAREREHIEDLRRDY